MRTISKTSIANKETQFNFSLCPIPNVTYFVLHLYQLLAMLPSIKQPRQCG